MRFAIRDDDTSAHTSAAELDRLWSPILPYAPVSLAVTPFAVPSYHLGDEQRFYQGLEPRPLSANAELVAWLRARLEERRITVMCHGYTHQYQRLASRRLVPEFVWKPSHRLRQETELGKEHLESTLGVPVQTFVPPGNGISRSAIEAVRPCFTRLLAAFPLRRFSDLRLEREYIGNYARRLYYQLRAGMPNPLGETVAGVRLLPSFSITPLADWERLQRQFETCREVGADFVVAVHYWEMKGHVRTLLERMLELANRNGCRLCSCDELFSRDGSPCIELRPARAGVDARLGDY